MKVWTSAVPGLPEAHACTQELPLLSQDGLVCDCNWVPGQLHGIHLQLLDEPHVCAFRDVDVATCAL